METNEEVAMKLEHCMVAPSMVREEADIYRSLVRQPGFPRVYWYGSLDDFTIMVFELLGPNLEDLFRYCGNKFSLKTTLMLADQLLRRFEALHSNDYLHRDVKPDNFLLGTGTRGNILYMTDLGLAIYHRTGQWGGIRSPPSKAPTDESRLIGTCRYASINGHLGVGRRPGDSRWNMPADRLTQHPAQSRRDDLEALGYMLVYFRRGKLPWQGLTAPNAEARYRRVLEVKQTTSVNELCEDLPAEFAEYMSYVHSLREDDVPDYRYLRKLFAKLFHRQGFEYDNVFDWTIREFQRLEIGVLPPSI